MLNPDCLKRPFPKPKLKPKNRFNLIEALASIDYMELPPPPDEIDQLWAKCCED